MSWFRKIVHLLLLIPIAIGMPVVLSVAYASGQVTAIYPNQIVDFSIEEHPSGSTYNWEIYCGAQMGVNMAQEAGTCGDATVVNGQGTHEAQLRFNTPGEYLVKIEVWDPVACTNNMKFYRIEVEESLPTAALDLAPNEICITVDPTNPEFAIIEISFTGEQPWKFTLEGGTYDVDGNFVVWDRTDYDNITDNPMEITVSPTVTTIYRVVDLHDNNGGPQPEPSNSVTLTVHPLPTNSPIYLKE
jgi:hypothetical protein